METIRYRNTDILVKTIPKNTLLFRIPRYTEDDFNGVKLPDGTRCLTPNYNVFFYPNPFAGYLALEGFYKSSQQSLVAYRLVRDVKVIWLLDPSRYYRGTKNAKSMFVKRCSTVKKGCLPRTGREYDPCVSDTIVKKYPDVVGMIAIAYGDNKVLKEKLKKTVKLQKYFKIARDSRKRTGIPELILHPLAKRPQEDVISSESDVHEYNYEIIKDFKKTDISKLTDFMNKHTKYDPETFFYTYVK
jgi:hypothetical protein